MSSLMVTGHRPSDFTPESERFAKRALRLLAHQAKRRWASHEAISGMALGADTWWARAALEVGLPLAAYIPFEAQPTSWTSQEQATWQKLRRSAHREVVLGKSYDVRLFHARNEAMIRDSDLAIAVWDRSKLSGGTASTVKKLRAAHRPLIILALDSCEVLGERLPQSVEKFLNPIEVRAHGR